MKRAPCATPSPRSWCSGLAAGLRVARRRFEAAFRQRQSVYRVLVDRMDGGRRCRRLYTLSDAATDRAGIVSADAGRCEIRFRNPAGPDELRCRKPKAGLEVIFSEKNSRRHRPAGTAIVALVAIRARKPADRRRQRLPDRSCLQRQRNRARMALQDHRRALFARAADGLAHAVRDAAMWLAWF